MNRRTVLRSAALSVLASSVAPKESELWAQAQQWQPDGVGSRARLGVLTPDFDPVPESEITAMAPRGVSVHSSRVQYNRQARSFAEPPHVDSAVDRLAELAPRVILFGFSSSSYVIERREEDALRVRLEGRARGSAVILTTLAAVAAFRALKVQRIAIMHPPWFSADLNASGERYYRGHGFEVVQCARMTPERTFTEVPPAEVFERARALVPPSAEALFIGGNGLRVVGTIGALEESIGRPVLTANQVLLWAALQRVGGANEVTRYGRVFRAANGRG